jgi:hypothetical protein
MPAGGTAYVQPDVAVDRAAHDTRKAEMRRDMLPFAWHEFRYPRPATDEPTDAFRRAIEVCVDSAAAREVALLTAKDAETAGVWSKYHDDLGSRNREIAELQARIAKALALLDTASVNDSRAERDETFDKIRAALEPAPGDEAGEVRD